MPTKIEDINIRLLNQDVIKHASIKEALLHIEFQQSGEIVIEDYWEFYDENQKLLDHSMGSKLRKGSSIHLLEGRTVVSAEKMTNFYFIQFEDKKSLMINHSERIKKYRESLENSLLSQKVTGERLPTS